MLMPRLREDHQEALRRARALARSLARGRPGPDALGTLARLGRSAPTLLSMFAVGALRQRRLRPYFEQGWSYLHRNAGRFGWFSAQIQIELVPDPANRVVLADECDPFGRRLASVRWKWGQLDLESLHRSRALYASLFAAAGLRPLAPPSEEDAPDVAREGINHHIGTTRMHPDPGQGVVDADGRVHGVDNVYATGSSVFPTGGYQNPTLTIVALAIRLADHLKRRL
jgi:choline dehydrogenase-like flavoprotein